MTVRQLLGPTAGHCMTAATIPTVRIGGPDQIARAHGCHLGSMAELDAATDE
jgi:hypothetical protein